MLAQYGRQQFPVEYLVINDEDAFSAEEAAAPDFLLFFLSQLFNASNDIWNLNIDTGTNVFHTADFNDTTVEFDKHFGNGQAKAAASIEPRSTRCRLLKGVE